MEILIYIVVYAIAIAIGVAVLAGSLFLVEDVQASSFKEFGALNALVRCAAIVVATNLIGLIPYGGFIALAIWFVGIMFLFKKTFLQTLLLFVVNIVVAWTMMKGLEFVLSKLLPD